MLSPIKILDDETGCIELYPDWLPNSEYLFDTLKFNVAWKSRDIQIFGREVKVPRLEYWTGEAGISYSYSGQQYVSAGWIDNLGGVVERITSEFSWSPNGALLNYYRDGQDSMGWHSDNEQELGLMPVVTILSLGCQRELYFRKRLEQKTKLTVNLASGSLLVMKGDLQRHWQHSLPKRRSVGSRISVTFRLIKTSER